jgi:CHAT domain-containing protein
VYSRLGQPLEAIALLCNPNDDDNCSSDSAVEIARNQKDTLGEAAALGSLGDARRFSGKYELAITNLTKSLNIVNKRNNPKLQISVLNSLGNAHISQAFVKYRRAESAKQRQKDEEEKKWLGEGKQEDAKAQGYLQESLKMSRTQKDVQTEMRSLLRLISLYNRNNNTIEAKNSLQQAKNLLQTLPNNRGRVYATIDLVHLLQPGTGEMKSSKIACLQPETLPQAANLLNQAVTIAHQLGDFRAESFALGELGHIYECRQEYPQALKITQKAILAAGQELKAQDSLYLWEWQTGRIFKAQGNTREAIAAYTQAIKTLDSIRRDILTANRDIQFDFRDTIEPIYRDLVALKLSIEQTAATVSQSLDKSLVSQEKKNNLRSVLETIDSLKLAELQNYFGSDCIILSSPKMVIDKVNDDSTAFINTIIFENQTTVILTLAKGEIKQKSREIKRQDIINKINKFRVGLEAFRDAEIGYDTTLAQEVYNWLVKPFENDLDIAKIKTLVFVQDGILRSVPMAALHDGKQFLIQKYAISTIPSLNLTDTKPINKQDLRILALGLSEEANIESGRLIPLSNVPQEIEGVIGKIPGRKLLNSEFTQDNLKKELDKQAYPIIHIATHGKFGADPEDTFLVTGEKDKITSKNETLSFNELESKIRSTTRNNRLLELLTLTACETATGDERSTLGLAGVAVQAGAKSALASLWSIQDNSTAKIAISFYEKLKNNPNMSKAEALQLAQRELIESKKDEENQFTHPAYWSPLILIGNWL